MTEKPGDNDGQVSETSTLEGADQPIQPDQAVAGAPDAESGEVQEGKTGPNARTGTEESDSSEESGHDAEDQSATHA